MIVIINCFFFILTLNSMTKINLLHIQEVSRYIEFPLTASKILPLDLHCLGFSLCSFRQKQPSPILPFSSISLSSSAFCLLAPLPSILCISAVLFLFFSFFFSLFQPAFIISLAQFRPVEAANLHTSSFLGHNFRRWDNSSPSLIKISNYVKVAYAKSKCCRNAEQLQ